MELKGGRDAREALSGFPHAVLRRHQRRGETRTFGPRPSRSRARRGDADGAGTRREPPAERGAARPHRGPRGPGAPAHARRVRRFRGPL